MFPRFDGRHPTNLLPARTRTDTGELPTLSGILEENLLWLMKMASRSFSKSFLGNFPSNSLNLMSRNFKLGNRRRTSGNLPANLLLLRSISNKSVRFLNMCGTVPQNLLELI